MSVTRDNHFVPQWYQRGFLSDKDNELRHLVRKKIYLPNGTTKTIISKNWYTPAQRFYKKDLYSIIFRQFITDDIEKKLFGPIDDNGSIAVRAFLTNDQKLWHSNFKNFFEYLDAQKLRTPKGLDWVKSKYPLLNQQLLMVEMQALQTIHYTFWTEGVRELVSAEDSNVKFIISDHPVTLYNYACPPESKLCTYPNDPDIALKGTQTIFPLDLNRCLILTNLEYAQDSGGSNPLEQRTHATRIRQSMVSSINFINKRKLSDEEVTKINHIIKSRAKDSVAAGNEEWLYPEKSIICDWSNLRHVLLPPSDELYKFSGEILAGYKDGTTQYQDAFGRTNPRNEYLNKKIYESELGQNDICGCGSGKKYKNCCLGLTEKLRPTWSELSIRERNLLFCEAIRDILGVDIGKSWLEVRRGITNEQIAEIYGYYGFLWPKETDIYSLMPKSDGTNRALYTGTLDTRVLGVRALPMASMFDEFLIQNPLINTNNVKPEFSPVESPGSYKYQALKDFNLMLNLEPYIRHGLINLIPSPSDFDLHLMRAVMDMSALRRKEIVSQNDVKLYKRLSLEDLLNSINMQSETLKIQVLMSEFSLNEADSRGNY